MESLLIQTRFVVLTTNRSGSTWLMSTLNSDPRVMAQGELFLSRRRSLERRWDSDFAHPRFIETRRDGTVPRPFSVFAFLDSLYSAPGAVGFKLMYAHLLQFPELLVYFVRHRIRIVHLVRQNHLDVLLSYAVKARLGKAHLLEGQRAPQDMTVELDAGRLLEQLAWLQRKQRVARWVLTISGLPHMEVAYEDLLRDPAHFSPIWQFLSLEPRSNAPRSSLVKIRRGSHRELIRNYDEVRHVLSGSRFAGLLE